MKNVRYIGDQVLTVPSLDLVIEPGDVVEVPDHVAADFEARPDFRAASEPAVKTVAVVLAEVGDDRALAAAALDTEQLRGAKARKTLVDALAAIVEPPAADADDPAQEEE